MRPAMDTDMDMDTVATMDRWLIQLRRYSILPFLWTDQKIYSFFPKTYFLLSMSTSKAHSITMFNFSSLFPYLTPS